MRQEGDGLSARLRAAEAINQEVTPPHEGHVLNRDALFFTDED